MDFSCLCFDGGLWKQKERYNEGINQEYYCNLNLAVSASISFSFEYSTHDQATLHMAVATVSKKVLILLENPPGHPFFHSLHFKFRNLFPRLLSCVCVCLVVMLPQRKKGTCFDL